MNKKVLQDATGFSLVNTLMSLALVSTLSLSTANLINVGTRSSHATTTRMDYLFSVNHLERTLQDVDVCGSAFERKGGQVAKIDPGQDLDIKSLPTEDALTTINQKIRINGETKIIPILKEGQILGSGLKVLSLFFRHQKDLNGDKMVFADNPVDGMTRHQMELVVVASRDVRDTPYLKAIEESSIHNLNSPIRISLITDSDTQELLGCESGGHYSANVNVPDPGGSPGSSRQFLFDQNQHVYLHTKKNCDNWWSDVDVSSHVPPQATKALIKFICSTTVVTARASGSDDSAISYYVDPSEDEFSRVACFGNGGTETSTAVVSLNSEKKFEYYTTFKRKGHRSTATTCGEASAILVGYLTD